MALTDNPIIAELLEEGELDDAAADTDALLRSLKEENIDLSEQHIREAVKEIHQALHYQGRQI